MAIDVPETSVGVIQTQPQGLLALLGIKGGKAPNLLSPQCLTVVEARDIFLLGNRELIIFSSTGGPVQGSNQFAGAITGNVPLGEMWYVWEFQTRASCGAAATITHAPAVIVQNNFPMIKAIPQAVPINSLNLCKSTVPFWAFQGDILCMNADIVTGVPVCAGEALVTRLRV